MRYLILLALGLAMSPALANDFFSSVVAEESITIQIAVNVNPEQFTQDPSNCDSQSAQCITEVINEVADNGQTIVRVIPI